MCYRDNGCLHKGRETYCTLLLTAFQSNRSAFVLIFLVRVAGTAGAQSAPPKSERDAYDAAIHCQGDMAMASVAERRFKVLSVSSKPDYLSDAEFARQKAEAGTAFHSLAACAAIKQSDYQGAQEHYAALVEMNPNNFGFVYRSPRQNLRSLSTALLRRISRRSGMLLSRSC